MRERNANAEPHTRRPALMQPTILAAEEDLVEAVGELHDFECVADAVQGAQLDAVAAARDTDPTAPCRR